MATRLEAVVGALLFAALPPGAAAQGAGPPPTGQRSTRPVATEVVVVESVCTAGELALTVRPGTAVAKRGSRAPAGKVAVTFAAGWVDGSCTLDEAALGARIARDLELAGEGGAAISVRAGALVQRRGSHRQGGGVRVESMGAARATFTVPADALTADEVEFVYRAPPVRRFVTPFQDTPLYAHAASVGTKAAPVAVIEGGREVVLLEQSGTLAHVRTHGEVEVEGWTRNQLLADRREEPDAQLLKPTHEVLTRAALYASASAAAPALALRGGALLEVGRAQGDRVQVTTTGPVVAEGWVDRAAVRPLATP